MARAKKVLLIVAYGGRWRSPGRTHLYDHTNPFLGRGVTLCGLEPHATTKRGYPEESDCRRCRKRAGLPLPPPQGGLADMGLITPSSSTATDVSQLEDHEPYLVEITAIDWDVSKPEYGGDKRLKLTLAFVDEKGNVNKQDTILDWLGLKLGQQQSGEIAKLRQLLNALAEEPKEAKVQWFNDETLGWGYTPHTQDPNPAMVLGVAQRVIVRGEVVTSTGQDGDPVRRYKVKRYQTNVPKKGRRPVAAEPQEADRATAVDIDDIPI